MRKLLYDFIQTSLFAILSCIGLSLQAQDTPFIQPVSADHIPDSPEMAAYRERLRKNPNITGYHLVKLNALANSQKDGVLPLPIPDSPTITAIASHVEYKSANEYEWIGKTDDGCVAENAYKVSAGQNNFIQVVHYDKETGELEGKFQVTLAGTSRLQGSNLPDTVRFTEGRFLTKVVVGRYIQ